MPNRAKSGYILFTSELRPSVTAELKAVDEKAGVVAVSKILGQKWKDLSTEQRDAYNARAAEEKKKAKEQHDNNNENNVQDRVEDAGPPPSLPISTIKKIMTTDEEVKRVSAESIQIMSKATELLLAYLVERALEEAKKDKRKLIKLPDIESAVQLDPRLKATNTLAHLKQLSETTKKRKGGGLEEEEGDDQAKPPTSKKSKKKDAKDPGQTTTITSFLQPK
ncbi:hypothetical protein BSKO_08685 [Bryopsis sp. KO-2023]|nr:hypothetical protein BSKO_08685 [Bryopsis sp. KO-2023]